MTTVLNGLVGGAVVAVLAGTLAAATARFGDDPPVTDLLLAAAFDERPSVPRWARVAGSLLYGSLAGGAFLALELSVLEVLAVPPGLGEALAATLGWSAVLFGFAAGLLGFVGGGRSVRASLGELATYHLVYGLGLGVWIRLTWIT